MIIPKTPHASEVPRSIPAQLSRKRTAIVVAVLPVAAAFVIASPSTAIAAPAFTNNNVTSISGLHSTPCRGEKPGVCPDSSSGQHDVSAPTPVHDGRDAKLRESTD